jgi:SAM-dependent methyltransferase
MPDPLDRLVRDRFPKSAAYHPDWILANGSGGNALWLTEWLTDALPLQPGMRVLDLGCGRLLSSLFLAREFGVQVYATDLWVPASENQRRIVDAGFDGRVIPIHADARALPFAADFFDAIVCVDAFYYFGTDALYLNYLAQFVKPGGPIGVAGAGLTNEFPDGVLPAHLQAWWTQDCWSLQSAAWLSRLWSRTGIVNVELADSMPDGWRVWLDWHHQIAPDNHVEIAAIEADAGRHIGYVRVIGRRNGDTTLEPYCSPDPLKTFPAPEYKPLPLLREIDESPNLAEGGGA